MAIFDGIKKLFKNNVNLNDQSVEIDDVLLSALLNGEEITRDKAMTLPAVSSAVDFISSSVACMPVKLYKYKQGKVVEVEGDTRVKLLNGDTGDTLNAYEMKKAMVEDYLLDKGGYAVIRKNRNDITGLFYVEPIYVTILKNADPVYKYVTYEIVDKQYKTYQLLRILRNTKDGAKGKSVIKEISKCLETAYSTLLYQLGLVKSGGNKKGFLLSENRLTQEDIDKLKTAWRNLYANNVSNVVVLNKGVKFQESSSSSTEMQLNESKKTLNEDIDAVFHISNDFNDTFKKAIYPVVKAFESALNSVLLLENEKRYMFFELDVKEIVRANLKERYEAYKMAKDIGMKTINELRKEENLNYIEGMDVIPFSLGSVLYDTKNGTYFTPNTDTITQNGEQPTANDTNAEETLEGGEK